ncbi:hypothetical protein FOCC_FOCC006224 [Frankliniella occidentalis]|nr:hypothetical protein FOCC_FOCC006224 [Frankliniella occidentalis]
MLRKPELLLSYPICFQAQDDDSDSDSQVSNDDSSNRGSPQYVRTQDVEESIKALADSSDSDSQVGNDDSNSRLPQVVRRQDVEESIKVVSQQPNLNEMDSQSNFDDSNNHFPLLKLHSQDIMQTLKVALEQPNLDDRGSQIQADFSCLEFERHVEESLRLVSRPAQHDLSDTTSRVEPNSESQSTIPLEGDSQLEENRKVYKCPKTLPTNVSHPETGSECEKSLSSEAGSETQNQSGITDFVQNGSTPLRENSNMSLSAIGNPQLSPVGSDSGSSRISDEELTSDSIDSQNSCSSHPNLDISDNERDNNSTFSQKLQVMDLYLENKESKFGFRRIVQTVSNLLPESNNLPSGSKILQFVEDLAPDVEADVHFFCKICLQYFPEKPDVCDVCDKVTEIGEFYTFDIAKIIKFLFESRDLASLIDSMPETDPSLLKDIQDGYVYQNANTNRGKYDVNVVLATDGVKVRKGSSKELWLLMFTPVEVPPHLKDSYTFIIGVWYDKIKPRVNTFLKPLCKNVESVEIVGIEWKHPTTGEVHRSSVRITLIVADAPARAMCQNLMNHNAKYGCNLCEIRTTKTRRIPGKKRKRVYKYVEDIVLRTKDSMKNNATEATRLGEPVKGVKGFSELSILSSVDISLVVFPEFMHSVLLGVTRQVVTIWIECPGQWSIANSLDDIDFLLAQIKHPNFVHSAFPFEGINGTVAKGCHGTNFVGKEIVNNIKIYQGTVILRNISQGLGVEQSILNTEPTVLGGSKKIDLSLLDHQFFENKRTLV